MECEEWNPSLTYHSNVHVHVAVAVSCPIRSGQGQVREGKRRERIGHVVDTLPSNVFVLNIHSVGRAWMNGWIEEPGWVKREVVTVR